MWALKAGQQRFWGRKKRGEACGNMDQAVGVYVGLSACLFVTDVLKNPHRIISPSAFYSNHDF